MSSGKVEERSEDSQPENTSKDGAGLSKNQRRKLRKQQLAQQKREQVEADQLSAQKKVEQLTKRQIAKGKIGNAASHKFWDTQPVPKLTEQIDVEKNEPIEGPKDDVPKEPYPLLSEFVWSEVDADSDAEMQEVYTLLYENYVEDDDNMFRFDYSVEFLRWALQPPGWRKDWHLSVRLKKNNKMVAFITAIPAVIRVYEKKEKMVEINFLCIHKKLREKRLAPILIKEITRRVNLTDIWQAVYTAGIVLPKPISSCRYYHRSLNPKKLIEVGFSHLQPRMTIARTIRLYRLPEKPHTPGLRELTVKDVPEATALLGDYLKQFKLSPVFNKAEFKHWFLPRPGVVNTYVVENPESKKITDICSFYTLPSTIIKSSKYSSIKAAYSFYNVATSTDIVKLMEDCLILARQNNFDVFNALDIFENEKFLHELKFGIGDGHLQYYIYNWRCPAMRPDQTGLVLL